MPKTSHTYRLKEGTHDKLRKISLEHQRNTEESLKEMGWDKDKLNVTIGPGFIIDTLVDEEYKRLFGKDA